MEVVHGPRTGCGWDPISRVYNIMIRKDVEAGGDRFAAIAHEVYHRVTWTRWIHRVLYLDEMMAFLCTRQTLLETGYEELADEIDRQVRSVQNLPDVAILRRSRGRRPMGLIFNSYPNGFYPGVSNLGLDLLSLVGWSRLCRLAKCNDIDDWIAELPAESQSQVRALIGET
jgi:hypothetical protein